VEPYRDIPQPAADLHRRALVFDAHADTLTEMTDRGYDLDRAPDDLHIDLPKCADGVLDAQVFTCFVHPNYVGRGAADRVREMLDTMDRQLAHFPEQVALCTGPGEIAAARAMGKLAGLLAIEGGHAIEDDLDTLREFHARGVRCMTLTWNNSNEWADGCGDDGPHGGLTARGREVVAAMEELGVVVDISHVARSTFDGVMEVARAPMIASHSCSKVLRDHQRNLDDDQLRAIAERGGVACLNLYPVFLVESGEATLEHVLDHMDRFIEVAGAEHVGLGADYDGIGRTPIELPHVGALPRLTAGLLERGHDESTVEAVLGGNLLRVFEAVFAATKRQGGAAPTRGATS
jgi:membrane dipeptidase